MNPIEKNFDPQENPTVRLERESGFNAEQRGQLKKVARQFESVFMNQMVGAMRKTVTKGGLVPESQGEKVYQSMLDQRHAEQMSETEQIGLSKIIYEHLLRTAGAR